MAAESDARGPSRRSVRAANGVMHALHLAVISFSCVGWIWPTTRPLHLALAAGIAASWFVVGPALGRPGFCCLTGVQHALWARLGVAERPNYMSYLVTRLTGRAPNVRRVERATQAVFYATTAASIALSI